jgi:outer membrane immunogenic protein
LLGGAAIAALTLAAENPARAAPPAPVFNWTGCYIGANVGGGWAYTHFGPPTREAGFQDIVGGGQVGCDMQMGMFVVGAQGMFDFSAMHGRTSFFGGKSFETRKPWFATATGRVGYLLAPNFLVSVEGGAAFIRDEHKFLEFPSLVHNAANVTRTGTVLGVSGEWLFAPNMSFFAQYNYIQFGTKSVAFHPVSGFIGTFNEDVRQHVQTFLVGVNFRFNTVSPPPPPY